MGDLAQAREFALSLPGTSEEPHFDMTSFRVGGKIFATAPFDGTRLHVFVDEGEVEAAVAEQRGTEQPRVFEPLLWGQRVRGVRIQLAAAPAERVRELLADAWRRKAAKRLVAEFDAAGQGRPDRCGRSSPTTGQAAGGGSGQADGGGSGQADGGGSGQATTASGGKVSGG